MTPSGSEEYSGPLFITERTVIAGTVTGTMTIAEGAHLRLMGQVVGDIEVRPGGELVVIGTVKGAVINGGGSVDIFGFVGRITDTGSTETMISRGAIVGGKRATRPTRLSTFLRAHP